MINAQKSDFQEEQMIFNRTAENIDSQTTNTSSSAVAEQPCEKQTT